MIKKLKLAPFEAYKECFKAGSAASSGSMVPSLGVGCFMNLVPQRIMNIRNLGPGDS